jgi:hypothetical protein
MGHILDHVNTVYPFPPKPTKLSADEKTQYIAKIKQLLKCKYQRSLPTPKRRWCSGVRCSLGVQAYGVVLVFRRTV